MMERQVMEHGNEAWSGAEQIAKLQAVLYRYCLSLTGSVWDADDLSQNAWIKALEILKERGHRNPEAFLLRIAKNNWIDQCRRKEALKERLVYLSSGDTAEPADNLEIESVFHALLRHCSPLQRTVFMLREVLDYTISETAELMHTTEGAVKAALYRARQTLAAIREELESGETPMPIDEERVQLLQELAAAYAEGDTEALIELLYQDNMAIVSVSAIGSYGPMAASSHIVTPYGSAPYGLRMSA